MFSEEALKGLSKDECPGHYVLADVLSRMNSASLMFLAKGLLKRMSLADIMCLAEEL